jgi:hypothetical protein
VRYYNRNAYFIVDSSADDILVHALFRSWLAVHSREVESFHRLYSDSSGPQSYTAQLRAGHGIPTDGSISSRKSYLKRSSLMP